MGFLKETKLDVLVDLNLSSRCYGFDVKRKFQGRGEREREREREREENA